MAIVYPNAFALTHRTTDSKPFLRWELLFVLPFSYGLEILQVKILKTKTVKLIKFARSMTDAKWFLVADGQSIPVRLRQGII